MTASSIEKREAVADQSTTSSGARRLATQGAVYAFGNAVIKASGLLLAPLLLNTTLLPRADYGHLGMLEITGQLAMLVAGLGLTSAMIRFAAEDGVDRESAPGVALVCTIISGLLIAALFWVLAGPLASWLLGNPDDTVTMRWYGVYAALQTMLFVPYGYIRFKERAVLFVLARVVEIAVLIGGVYFFLARQHLGIRGVVYAYVLSAAVAVVVLVVGMLRRVTLRFSFTTAIRMLRFGAPLAVGALALPILHAGDRYIIEWYLGAESLGVYYWGSRLSGLLNMLFVQSLAMAFGVIGMKAITAEYADVSLHRRAYRHYTVWAGLAVLALSLFAPEITRLLTDDARYPTAAPLVLPLSMGYLFYGHFILFSNTLQAARRTHVIALTVVTAATLNVCLNLVLIPAIGIYGAALATVVSYLLLASLAAYLGRRDFHVRYDWLGSAVAIALVVVLYVAADNLTAEPILRVVLRVIAVLVYLPMVVVLRVYRADEINVVRSRLRAFLRREGT